MLLLITAVLTWLQTFVQTRHDLGLESIVLRQQAIVLTAPDQASPVAAFRPGVLGVHGELQKWPESRRQ
jgi:hypothetical protein